MFIKNGFPFFWTSCAHLLSKFRKNADKSKKIVFSKNSLWVSKNTEFHADFKFIGKVYKKCTKKSLANMWWNYALFPLLLMFVKLVFLITLFWCIFFNFFNGFEISMKFCVFWYLFDIKKICFWSYQYFSKTLKPIAQKTPPKIK